MVTVIIPVLNESQTIRYVVNFAMRSASVTEVIVVDDGSIDGTPEIAASSGARVITSTLLGKGASMSDGIQAATNEFLVFLDGDLSSLHPELVTLMIQPLQDETADFVKAQFSRSAGRVTILTARPLLQTFFPELNHIEQPLGGIISGRRSLLQNLRLETDYGVDVGLLIDAVQSGARIAQVGIGRIEHDSQRLEVLGDMARQVSRTILNRASRYGRLSATQVEEVEEIERSSQIELGSLLTRVTGANNLAIFDMDGTLVLGRFVESLAQRINCQRALEQFLDNPNYTSEQRMQHIAAMFAGVPKQIFEDVASRLELVPGARELIVRLRSRGYRVGIISDSYFVATEIIRRRVFADFSIAHLMRFREGVATGRVTVSSAMRHPFGCREHVVCKQNALLHLGQQLQITPDRILAVGDGLPDCCMFAAAGVSFAFQPKSPEVANAADFVIHDNLLQIETLLGVPD